MPADTQLVATPPKAGSSVYTLPPNLEFRLKAVRASFDGSGAASAWLPAVIITSDSVHGIADAVDPDTEVAAGASAVVSFFPRGRRRVTASGPTLDYNIGEIGNAIGTALASVVFANVTYQDVRAGDGILILAAAPSNPGGGNPIGHPAFATDSFGNSYTAIASFAFEANPPNVNEGLYATLFWCPASTGTLVVGVDNFDVIWDNGVYDRVIEVWSVRHSGGASTPTVLAATADHDAAVYAAANVTLTTPDYTPARDSSLQFALLLSAKIGGVGGFGSVIGYTGFFQAEFRGFAGSQQSYLYNQQTHGADAYLIASSGTPPYEDDVGQLPGGVLVPSFNGVGQSYTAGASAWKGVILLGLD